MRIAIFSAVLMTVAQAAQAASGDMIRIKGRVGDVNREQVEIQLAKDKILVPRKELEAELDGEIRSGDRVNAEFKLEDIVRLNQK